jgi:hypothetical protein
MPNDPIATPIASTSHSRSAMAAAVLADEWEMKIRDTGFRRRVSVCRSLYRPLAVMSSGRLVRIGHARRWVATSSAGSQKGGYGFASVHGGRLSDTKRNLHRGERADKHSTDRQSCRVFVALVNRAWRPPIGRRAETRAAISTPWPHFLLGCERCWWLSSSRMCPSRSELRRRPARHRSKLELQNMTVTLNHILVPAKNKQAAAHFFRRFSALKLGKKVRAVHLGASRWCAWERSTSISPMRKNSNLITMRFTSATTSLTPFSAV